MSKKPTYEELEQRVKELEKEVADYELADEAMDKRAKQIIHNQMALLELAKTDYSDLESALKEITKVDAETLNTERVSVWFFSGDRSEIVCESLYNVSKNFYEKGARLQAKQYPRYFQALEESRIVAANDAQTDPCTSEFTKEYLKPLGITSMMDVPVRLHGGVAGIVCHEHTGPMREWTLEEQDFAASIADMLSLAMEASERKQAEEALRESEEKYRSLFDFSINPTSLLDRDGNFLMMNQTGARHLGGRPGDFIGKSLHEVLPENAKDLVGKHSRVFESGTGIEFEVLIELPSGNRWFLSTGHPIRDAVGRIFAIQIIYYDITDRKRAEEAIKESAEKIKLFAYSVSHDLKTPAIGIYGLTKLLYKNYKDILDEKGKDYCDQILKASEQLAALVEQINVYISTKESPLTVGRVNLRQVFKMVRDEFSTQISIRQISWSEPESMPEINVERLSILRVLRNFVDNALKYGGDELSEINMGYEESDKFHIFSVKDDGVGIAEGDSKKIFGLFERNVTSRGIEGTGLGLAIAKEIAEKHNGRVWAEPGREKGTIFYLSISKDLRPS